MHHDYENASTTQHTPKRCFENNVPRAARVSRQLPRITKRSFFELKVKAFLQIHCMIQYCRTKHNSWTSGVDTTVDEKRDY